MFIEEECDGSDDEDNDGGYQIGMDDDANMAGADESYVDDEGIFVSKGGCERNQSNSCWLGFEGN